MKRRQSEPPKNKNCEIFMCEGTTKQQEYKMLQELQDIFNRGSNVIERIGIKSNNAYAMVVKGYHENKIVIKKPRRQDGTVDSLKYEYIVGCDLRNTMCKQVPNFMKVYGYLHRQNQEYLIIQRICPGKTLRELLCFEKVYTDFYDPRLRSLILQVLCSLQVAQNSVRFTHYDLHFGNVLVKNDKKKKNIVYRYRDKNGMPHTVRVPLYGEIAIIIDFGRSRTNESSVFLQNNPQYFKPYQFLLKAKHNNIDIRKFDPVYDTKRFCSILAKYIPNFRFDPKRQRITEPHDIITEYF
jgi:hypothetical protein